MTSDVTCREIVEVVTDYLEGALPPEERVRLEQHLLLCDGCSAYLEQIRLTVRVSRALGEDELRLHGLEALLEGLLGRTGRSA